MAADKYEDDCPDCRPVLLDVTTGKPLDASTPEMKVVLDIWETLTRDEKQLFHDFTCTNSRTDKCMRLMKSLSDKIAAGMKAAGL